MSIANPSGITRMMFSVMPPPVMCAIAWMDAPFAPRKSSSTGLT